MCVFDLLVVGVVAVVVVVVVIVPAVAGSHTKYAFST